MNTLKVLVIFLTTMVLCLPLLAQQENIDKYDRIYRVPANRSMYGQSVQQTAGGAYIVLNTVDTLDPAIPDVTATNLTQFDAKGNVNWSVDYTIEDTLSLMPYGNVILASEDGYVFSAKSKFEAEHQNFVIRVDSQGDILWSRRYASGATADSIGRIDIISPVEGEIVLLGSIEVNGKTETKLTALEEESGDIIWDRIITITDQANNTISPDIRNMSVTQDSNIIITGSVLDEEYIFVNKHNQKTGEIIWSRKYEVQNVPDARIIANDITVDQDSNLLITGLVDSDILGNAASGRQGVSDAYVLSLDRDGLVDWSGFFDFGESIISSGTAIAVNETNGPLVMIGGQNNAAGAFFPIQAILDSSGSLITARDYSIFLNSTSNNAEIISTEDNGSMLVATGIEHGIDSPGETDLGFFYPRLIKTDPMAMTLCDTAISTSFVPMIIEADTLIWNVANRPGEAGDTLEVEAFAFSAYTAPTLSLRDTMFCPGDPVSFLLDATTRGATAYQWFKADEPDKILSDDSTFLATELDVQYVAQVRVDEDLCYIMCDTTVLTEIMPPMVNLAANLEQYCVDRSIGVGAQISGSRITSIEWSTGERNVNVIFPNAFGSYSVTVTNICGDNTQASVNITEADLPQAQDLIIIKENPNLCTTGAITLTAQNQGLTGLLWSTGEQTRSIDVSESGTYTLMATDFCDFEVENSIQVVDNDFLPELSVSLENETDDCSNGFVPIEADIAGNINLITWTTADGEAVPMSVQVNPLRVDSAGTYTIRVVDICDNVEEASIDVSTDDLNDCGRTSDECLEFPNAFIPSSMTVLDDGSAPNRNFGPHNKCSDTEIESYSLKIFNRWGQQVFSTDTFGEDWNGRAGNEPNGSEYPGDVYVWVAKYSSGADDFNLKGDLTLIR